MCLVMSSFSIVINLFIKLFPESLLKSDDKVIFINIIEKRYFWRWLNDDSLNVGRLLIRIIIKCKIRLSWKQLIE